MRVLGTGRDAERRLMVDGWRAEKLFGFRAATGLRQGLERTIDWYCGAAREPLRD